MPSAFQFQDVAVELLTVNSTHDFSYIHVYAPITLGLCQSYLSQMRCCNLARDYQSIMFLLVGKRFVLRVDNTHLSWAFVRRLCGFDDCSIHDEAR